MKLPFSNNARLYQEEQPILYHICISLGVEVWTFFLKPECVLSVEALIVKYDNH